jgi:predicted house-cleaning noncanonical NTP pyrophosphatase (MazG superfamily)
MKKFKFQKLVRDKIVPLIKSNGSIPKYRKLTKKQFRQALIAKLKEEVDEIPGNPDKKVMAEEIADIKQVINYLEKSLDISKKDLDKIQKEKTDHNGAFDEQLYIEYVECDENDPWLKYFLNNPDKYPEV